MFFRFIFISFIFFSSQSFGYEGFEHGPNFTTTLLQGKLTINCHVNQNIKSAVFTCHQSVLEPVGYDYFIGPKTDADEVELIVTHEGGTSRGRRINYDGNRGRSLDGFNLWQNGLFSRPILKDGKNSIHVYFYKDHSKVYENEFTTMVNHGGVRQCEEAKLDSNDPSDCESPFSACDRYFELFCLK